ENLVPPAQRKCRVSPANEYEIHAAPLDEGCPHFLQQFKNTDNSRRNVSLIVPRISTRICMIRPTESGLVSKEFHRSTVSNWGSFRRGELCSNCSPIDLVEYSSTPKMKHATSSTPSSVRSILCSVSFVRLMASPRGRLTPWALLTTSFVGGSIERLNANPILLRIRSPSRRGRRRRSRCRCAKPRRCDIPPSVPSTYC